MLATQTETPALTDERTAQDQINQVIMATFGRTLSKTHLPPVVVLRMIASALGKTYADAAAAHQHGRCGCGWQPAPQSDVELLRSAFAYAVACSDELRSMVPAGHA